MKTVIFAVSCLVASNAMAIDFDTEWAKFESDFSKFKSYKVAMVQPKKTEVKPEVEVIVEDVPANEIVKVDPKSPDRLGYKLEDPAMRQKLSELYKKPDTVVYATTIR